MSLWGPYFDGDDGRWAFRAERLRHRNGLSLVEALDRDPWQRELLEIVDAPETRLAYFDATRGLGKTTLAAAIGVERLVLRDSHDVLVFASDRDQARILFDEAKGFVERDSALGAVCSVYRDEIANEANGSTLRVLSTDGVGSFGFGARSFTAIIDEFWAQPNRMLFDAMWSAVPKAPGSQVIILTNAGPSQDGVAWETRELCRLSTDPALRYWASADRDVIPSWIDPAQVDLQRRTLPPSVFARLWRGEWGHGGGDFLTREQVEACIDEKLSGESKTFSPWIRYYLGIDLGLKHDRSVVVVVHKERERIVVDHVRTWYGTPEHPVSLEDVAAHLLLLGQRIKKLRRGFIDPWQGVMLLERLHRAGMRTLEEYSFVAQRVQQISQALWNAFRSGQIAIPPHTALVEELVTARIVERRYGWRVDHETGGFSDHLIALGLAIVASAGDHGELVAENPTDTAQIEGLLAHVHRTRRFGFRRRVGLSFVGSDGPPENYNAAIRLLQLMLRTDRLSTQEAESIATGLRSELEQWPQVRHQLEHTTDHFDDDAALGHYRLGSLSDFIKRRWIIPPAHTEESLDAC